MGAPTALWIAEPTGRCRVTLRRFRHRPGNDGHLHDATVTLSDDEQSTPRGDDGQRLDRDVWRLFPYDDPRWPAACECGEPFTADDEWQVNELDWYEGTGGRWCWGVGSWDAPAGAMFRAPWRDQDGLQAWMVGLPNGRTWCTLEYATVPGGHRTGSRWQVTGEPPAITVHPSINDQSPTRPWHGWIRDGKLIDA